MKYLKKIFEAKEEEEYDWYDGVKFKKFPEFEYGHPSPVYYLNWLKFYKWFDKNKPVIVVGAEDGIISRNRYQEFDNIIDAQKVFPDLLPNCNGKRFASAMSDGGRIRFETWAVEKISST